MAVTVRSINQVTNNKQKYRKEGGFFTQAMLTRRESETLVRVQVPNVALKREPPKTFPQSSCRRCGSLC